MNGARTSADNPHAFFFHFAKIVRLLLVAKKNTHTLKPKQGMQDTQILPTRICCILGQEKLRRESANERKQTIKPEKVCENGCQCRMHIAAKPQCAPSFSSKLFHKIFQQQTCLTHQPTQQPHHQWEAQQNKLLAHKTARGRPRRPSTD